MSEQNLLKERFQVLELLGRGGMAVVYRARDRMLERNVALKVLKQDYAKDPAFVERFRQEAKAAAKLTHPNIVTIHDFGVEEMRPFIVMEFVPGKDLNSIIEEKGRLDIRDGVELAIKACRGIGYAHRAGLVHCDVKPHNFMVTADNQLKVTDFGIARALASINPDEETDIVWGSPQFFSPEQASGLAPSPASDVYSMGVVMYLMFTGQLPFIGKTAKELAQMHHNATPISPSEINPFIPTELDQIILKVLSKERSARYRTADQLGRVLQLVADRLDSGPVPSQPKPSSSSSGRSPSKPITRPQPIHRDDPEEALKPEEDDYEYALPSPIDWVAVGLGLAALTSVAGLVPFGIWVFNTFFPTAPLKYTPIPQVEL